MSVIITVNEARLHLLTPGKSPGHGLRNALELIREALSHFPAKPGAQALAGTLSGVAWRRHFTMLRIIPTATPTERTTHLITLDVSNTPTLSISTSIHDLEDDTYGQIHEGTFVAGGVLEDIDTLVRALT